jgi:hypothetical protein
MFAARSIINSCAQIPFSESFTVGAGAVTNVSIPLETMIIHYDEVETNAIHITASQPVSVYGFDYLQNGSAAFTGYPTTLLGTNYCVMARAAAANNPGWYSQLAVVATADDTTVWITPSTNAGLEAYDGTIYTNAYSKTLNQWQTYQINSSDYTGDVTGTRITSSKPIAVFAGASAADVPDDNTAAGNPLVQEQLPVAQWGTNVVAMSFAGRLNGDTYRVLAANSNTVVTNTGTVVTVINANAPYGPWTVTTSNEVVTVTITNAGQFYDIIVDGPVQFQSTKPIQVAQFANGVASDNPPFKYGDPCEILLLPIGHYLETNTVVTLTNDYVTGDFGENFLNLIVAQSAITNTLVDGSHIASTNFVAIGTSGYYGAQLTVTNSGAHTVSSSQPVGVEVYGFGFDDAYGYFGGVVK